MVAPDTPATHPLLLTSHISWGTGPDPKFISMPESWGVEPEAEAFRVIILSSTTTFSLYILVVYPSTVRLPPITTLSTKALLPEMI